MLLDILARPNAETLESFAKAWHGEPQVSAPSGRRPPSTHGIPGPLVMFYELASRWPALIVQNHLLDPPGTEDERLVFYVENQGVCSWMTSLDGGDPPVWVDCEGENLREGEPLSRFLITVAVLEAVIGAPQGASAAWLSRDAFAGGFGILEPLPYAPWHRCPEAAAFYASSDLLCVAATNRTPDHGDDLSVWIGAQEPAALSALDAVITEDWEYDSRRTI